VLRLVRIGASLLLIIVILLVGGGWLYLRSSLPQIDGEIAVAGLHGPVRIARDADGVPLIEAQDDADAAFGLGFAHAQDRLFQMELQRRYGAGCLAEIFGAPALPTDRQMRVLGLYRSAAASFNHLSRPAQQTLEAYSAGVNAFLATRSGALPPEFLLLRFAPEPWTPADSLVWGKLMDLELAGNYRGELLRARLARTVSPDDLAFLYPGYPKDATTTLAAIYRQLPLRQLYAALPERVGLHFASNNWVVDGAHSDSGKPVLANDPHLRFGAPGFWYLARLKTPEREIAGGTAAGAPSVVIGHNDRIAWGFTTTGSDVEDLFIEKIDPADPGRYLTPDGPAPFATRQETITVKGAAADGLTVRSTRHGPVLSDALPTGTADSGYVLALQTTFLGDDDTSADALWRMNRATDWNGFRGAFQDFVAPQQNMVFADTGGAIGFIAPAHIPIRKSGNGWMPVPGWTGEYDWTGTVPFEALPQGMNPSSGHFVSANNKIVPDSYQADTVSIMARRLVPLMTAIAPPSAEAKEAVARLRQWDFRMDHDKVEPLIFTAWLRNFTARVLFARLGEAAEDYWDFRPQVMEAILRERPDWCGDPKEPPPANCNAWLEAALNTTLVELRRNYGSDVTGWHWGRSHIAEFDNPVFGRTPVLRDWLRVSIPTAGGNDTINRGPSTIRDKEHPFVQRFGAGLRIVTDLASPKDSWMIAAPGQSGNPLSPHFADLVEHWRDFRYLTPGRAEPVATLTLVPSR
jgi:penicillin amidase